MVRVTIHRSDGQWTAQFDEPAHAHTFGQDAPELIGRIRELADLHGVTGDLELVFPGGEDDDDLFEVQRRLAENDGPPIPLEDVLRNLGLGDD